MLLNCNSSNDICIFSRAQNCYLHQKDKFKKSQTKFLKQIFIDPQSPDFSQFLIHSEKYNRLIFIEMEEKGTKHGRVQKSIIAYTNSKIPSFVKGCFKEAFSFINAGANFHQPSLCLFYSCPSPFNNLWHTRRSTVLRCEKTVPFFVDAQFFFPVFSSELGQP